MFVAASASRRISILIKSQSVFRDIMLLYPVVFGRLFFLFLSIVLQSDISCCYNHLFPLNRAVRSVFRMSGGSVHSDLWLRRSTSIVVLLFIPCVSCFLSIYQLVDPPAILLLSTPSLL